jgi:hypothetical protein
METNDEHGAGDELYTIQGSPYDYYAGVTADGLQMLIVVAVPHFISLSFDREGNLIEVQRRLLSETTRLTADRFGIHEALAGPLDEELDSWLRAFGFREAPIRVKAFFCADYHIGIKSFPEYYTSIIINPAAYTADERQIAQAERKRWSSEGVFELWLNEGVNLWIDRSGQVESS